MVWQKVNVLWEEEDNVEGAEAKYGLNEKAGPRLRGLQEAPCSQGSRFGSSLSGFQQLPLKVEPRKFFHSALSFWCSLRGVEISQGGGERER